MLKSLATLAVSVLTTAALALGPGSAAMAADPPPDPPGAVSVPGTFGAQVGCPGNWQPECPQVQLAQRAVDDVWSTTLTLDAGDYEYKATVDNSFDENYGAGAVPGGPNVELTVPADGTAVTFYYDQATHWVTTDADAPIVTAAGSFQSELGCPGDWSPDCLRSWLQDPDGDGTYTFTTDALPAGDYEVKAAVNLSWDLAYGQGGDPAGGNIGFSVPNDGDQVTFSYAAATNVLTVLAGDGLPSLRPLGAYWLDRAHIGWDAAGADEGTTYRLYAAPDGGLTPTPDGLEGGTSYPLTLDPAGLPDAVQDRFPAQAGLASLVLSPQDAARAEQLLTGQVAVAAFDASGALVDATGLQVPGVLDDVYAAAGEATLGLTWAGGAPTAAVWAPTAKDVSLQVYDDGQSGDPAQSVAMTRGDDGVWSTTGDASWEGRYYLFSVRVYVPETGRVETNLVTDPYSVGLSRNSVRSLFVDLDDEKLLPAGWKNLGQRKPALAAPVDQSITELHVRDFSAADPTVPEDQKGTYLAFTRDGSAGVKNLKALARAGATTVHLLPTNDIATRSIDEDRSRWESPDCDLPSLPPDSPQQQACITAVQGSDGYNWGYDPLHYTVPEGSYSTDPQGAARTLQYRQMVSSLNGDGLRVVMDVVYNHTADAGQTGENDLDRIVPGYYHRLDASGRVTTSTCCSDTASEHLMMGKLMTDSVLTWAEEYKVDGFRFDLMGFHPKAVMVGIRERLDALTVARDGVDGTSVYLYGEGWDFGTVADDALFVQATQANMAGTGIGTFNDRIRDAVRGGRFDDTDPRTQGWGSGLVTDPNGAAVNGDEEAQRALLALESDRIKVGLAGNLADYTFTDRNGATVTGSEVDYDGQPTGYNAQPGETVNYVDAHDDLILYDQLAYKLPPGTSMAERARMQALDLSVPALSQGVMFWAKGSEAMRSKSFDANSYDSGDWFNALDPTLTDSGFGHGLPPAADNEEFWPFAQPRLADPALDPTPAAQRASAAQVRTMLTIRENTPLLHLGSAAAVQQKVSFPLSGPEESPGVIVERIDDTVGADADPERDGLMIVFNASPDVTYQTVPGAEEQGWSLVPSQRWGSDATVRRSTYDAETGAFSVPGRTVAVFERR